MLLNSECASSSWEGTGAYSQAPPPSSSSSGGQGKGRRRGNPWYDTDSDSSDDGHGWRGPKTDLSGPDIDRNLGAVISVGAMDGAVFAAGFAAVAGGVIREATRLAVLQHALPKGAGKPETPQAGRRCFARDPSSGRCLQHVDENCCIDVDASPRALHNGRRSTTATCCKEGGGALAGTPDPGAPKIPLDHRKNMKEQFLDYLEQRETAAPATSSAAGAPPPGDSSGPTAPTSSTTGAKSKRCQAGAGDPPEGHPSYPTTTTTPEEAEVAEGAHGINPDLPATDESRNSAVDQYFW